MTTDENGQDGGDSGSSPFWLKLPEELVGIAGTISTLLILAIFFLIIYAIAQRYFLDTPLKWGDEMAGYLLVAMVMFGAAEALRRGDHIAIDLLVNRLPVRGRRFAAAFSWFAVLAISLIIAYSAYEAVTFAYSFDSYSPGYLEAPMWIPKLTVLLGAGLMSLLALARLARVLVQRSTPS